MSSESVPGEERAPFIVVGVDGSPNSKRALRWALDEAQLRGCELHALTAFGYMLPGFAHVPLSKEAQAREARLQLEGTLEEVVGDKAPVPLRPEIVAGNPVPALVEASRGAEMLVVGDRGYGGFAGLLLGFVGEQCARRAACTVVVVRDR